MVTFGNGAQAQTDRTYSQRLDADVYTTEIRVPRNDLSREADTYFGATAKQWFERYTTVASEKNRFYCEKSDLQEKVAELKRENEKLRADKVTSTPKVYGGDVEYWHRSAVELSKRISRLTSGHDSAYERGVSDEKARVKRLLT